MFSHATLPADSDSKAWEGVDPPTPMGTREPEEVEGQGLPTGAPGVTHFGHPRLPLSPRPAQLPAAVRSPSRTVRSAPSRASLRGPTGPAPQRDPRILAVLPVEPRQPVEQDERSFCGQLQRHGLAHVPSNPLSYRCSLATHALQDSTGAPRPSLPRRRVGRPIRPCATRPISALPGGLVKRSPPIARIRPAALRRRRMPRGLAPGTTPRPSGSLTPGG